MAPHFAAQGVGLNTTEYVVAKKKGASGLVSALGTLMAIFTKLVEKARNAGLNDEDFHNLAKPEGDPLLDRIVQMMVEASNPKTMLTDTFKVTVDYTKSLDDMVEIGKFGWHADETINSEHFPFDARIPEEIEINLVHLVHLGYDATTDEVKTELDKMGLRPATLPELLALGAAHSELQRKFWIAASGSGWEYPGGLVDFPLLVEDIGGRGLDLRWRGIREGYFAPLRFAAVRK